MAPLLQLFVRPEALSVVRVDALDGMPSWALAGPGIAAVVRRDDELGVVCASSVVPEGVLREDGWIALEVAGPLDFALTGILVAVAGPLAEAGVSIYALSTYDTDVVLVRRDALLAAVAALEAVGHDVDVSRLS
jgi:uncharacterized protein